MNGLENLLSLNGEIFPMDNGYWVKFEAKKVEPSPRIPHSIRYSLTLHNCQVPSYHSLNNNEINYYKMMLKNDGGS